MSVANQMIESLNAIGQQMWDDSLNDSAFDILGRKALMLIGTDWDPSGPAEDSSTFARAIEIFSAPGYHPIQTTQVHQCYIQKTRQ
jgi:hypothetical protein